MKRLTTTGLIALTSLLLLSANASAEDIFFDNLSSAGPLMIGDTITIQLRLDTEGATNINAVGISVFADPAILSFVSGVSPGSILFNFSTFEGVPRIIQPFVIGSDPAGFVRAASFGSLTSTGISSADQLLATLTFEAVGPGTTTIDSSFQEGDDLLEDGASAASVTFNSSVTITVPEPNSIMMSLSALGTVFFVTRRRVSNIA